MTRPVLLFVAVASLAVLATGCGSSGGDSTTTTTTASATETWASGVCTSITTWQTALTSAADSLKSDPTKNGLQTAADDAKSATQTLASDLKGLGKPDTASGQQAKDSLDQLATNLQKDVDTMESAVTWCLRRERSGQCGHDGDDHARDDGDAGQNDVHGPAGTRLEWRAEGRVRELELLRLAHQRFLTPRLGRRGFR